MRPQQGTGFIYVFGKGNPSLCLTLLHTPNARQDLSLLFQDAVREFYLCPLTLVTWNFSLCSFGVESLGAVMFKHDLYKFQGSKHLFPEYN